MGNGLGRASVPHLGRGAIEARARDDHGDDARAVAAARHQDLRDARAVRLEEPLEATGRDELALRHSGGARAGRVSSGQTTC